MRCRPQRKKAVIMLELLDGVDFKGNFLRECSGIHALLCCDSFDRHTRLMTNHAEEWEAVADRGGVFGQLCREEDDNYNHLTKWRCTVIL